MAERRCLATGEILAQARMVRFVIGPENQVVPDLEGNLPGRGLWVVAERGALARAVAKRLFARAAKAPCVTGPELVELVETLLAKRCLRLLGLAQRAGQVVCGFEKVQERIRAKRIGLLLEASDGARDGSERLARQASGVPVVAIFSNLDLSLALGRENVVHAAVAPGRLAEHFLNEVSRLSGFRSQERSPAAAVSEQE